ncbi:MAG: SDR family oxidoreductase, partial [Lentisphaerae bacterium]|nr:SDR family oxidoreductase [Lentisphaerota bacterium]
AIHSFTGALALEAGPQHIRVNNIAPGYIVVERMSSAPGFDRDQIAAGIPLKRLGEPDDVGNMVVFLASDAASFITGQTYVLDGGVSRKLARTAT